MARTSNETINARVEALDPETRGLVLELAALLATTETVELSTTPSSVAQLAQGTPLIERLAHADVPAPSGSSIGEEIVPDAQPDPTPTAETGRAQTIELFEHMRTPPQMRNFLSQVMPEGRLSDTAFALPARPASVLAYTILTLYSRMPLRVEYRKSNTELMARHVGLYGQPVAAQDLDPSQPATGSAKLGNIIKRIQADVPLGVLDRSLDLATEQSDEAILAFIEETVAKIQRAHAGPEAEPVPDGFKRKVIKDTHGVKHAVLWNEETLCVIVDGVEYPAQNVSNAFRDRISIIKCLIRHNQRTFSSSQFHEKGVGKHGKQTEGAVSMAIRNAIREAEQIYITIGGKQVPILENASPRTYQLNQLLGGPLVNEKKFRPKKSDASPKKRPTEQYDPSEIRLTPDGIVILGNKYPVLEDGEKHYLRELLAVTTRHIDSRELASLVHRVTDPSDTDIEDTEEAMFELTRRRIVVEHVEEDGTIWYEINRSIEADLAKLNVIEFSDGDRLVLDEYDEGVIRELMLSARPVTMAELARRINPTAEMKQHEYDYLARFVKKYLYPHTVVKKERLPKSEGGGTTNRYFMPNEMKDALSGHILQ